MDNHGKNYKEFIKNKQRFRSKKHNEFTKEVNKIAWSAYNDERIQWIDSTEHTKKTQRFTM